jgi:YHS domain-containing protein
MRILPLVLLAGLSVGTMGFDVQSFAAGRAQATCPVLGGAIDKSVYADYKGKRIYFCCAGCISDFNKDPEGYIKKLEKEGVVLEKTPAGSKSKGSSKQPGAEKNPAHMQHH